MLTNLGRSYAAHTGARLTSGAAPLSPAQSLTAPEPPRLSAPLPSRILCTAEGSLAICSRQRSCVRDSARRRHTFDLRARARWQRSDCHGRTRRRIFREELSVNAVHRLVV